MKTTTQQQMTTERKTLGLSLLAGSWRDAFQSSALAASERPAASYRQPAARFALLAALCPRPNAHHQAKLSGYDCQIAHNIRGGHL